MKHAVPHDLGQEKARQVARAAFSSYERKFSNFSPRSTWVTDRRATISFTVKGITLSGFMEVHDASIDMDLNVPFVFRIFKGQAMRLIENEIREWIAKAKAGEV